MDLSSGSKGSNPLEFEISDMLFRLFINLFYPFSNYITDNYARLFYFINLLLNNIS